MSKQLSEQYLTPQEVEEFQQLMLEVKGIKLTPQEALDQGTRLIMLMEAMQKFEPIQLSGKDTVDVEVKRKENRHK